MRDKVYSKMFENVPCSMSDLSWKLNENEFSHNVVNTWTDEQTDSAEKVIFVFQWQ